jgi:uncharacterized protein
MAKTAMPLDELDQWLPGRADLQPAATNLSMLDGYVTAIVAGPVSFDPREWICPLLPIDADAFNHGGTPEFAAISAVAVRHNDISNILSTAPDQFEPIYRRKPNREIDARPWCRGFYAAMQLRMSAWAPLLNIDDINYGLLLPIFAHSGQRFLRAKRLDLLGRDEPVASAGLGQVPGEALGTGVCDDPSPWTR